MNTENAKTAEAPKDTRGDGLWISVRVDSIRTRSDGRTLRDVRDVETLVEATDQRFSPFVMAATLRALADEIYPPKPQF